MLDRWLVIFLACLLEAVTGYPRWLFARIKHPVVWMGSWIAVFEKNFNKSGRPRKLWGVATVLSLLAVTLAASFFIHFLGKWAEIIAIAMLLAQRSLYDHVHDVYAALCKNDLKLAREKVSRIVGRDVTQLDEAGVCRAAIESLAESFSDGVVAPLFWAVIFGLPGIACYKAINTADSMIGHKDERYREFGWFAARLDDAANYIPARMSGLLIALVSFSKNAWETTRRDARNHASPNAGWPEAAMAGALDLQLGGPQIYEGIWHQAAFIGNGSRMATAQNIRKALRIYMLACSAIWLMLLLVWL